MFPILMGFGFIQRYLGRRNEIKLPDHSPQPRPRHAQDRACLAAMPAGGFQHVQRVRFLDFPQAALGRSAAVRRRQAGRMTATLMDSFGRRIEYLRLSVTDRCNYCCCYCWRPKVCRALPTTSTCVTRSWRD